MKKVIQLKKEDNSQEDVFFLDKVMAYSTMTREDETIIRVVFDNGTNSVHVSSDYSSSDWDNFVLALTNHFTQVNP